MEKRQHSSHWGAFTSLIEDGRLVGVEPFAHDPHPSPIIDSVPGAVYADNRVHAPMVRKSWLEGGPGHATERRGADAFVEVSWERALDLVAGELRRVKDAHGNASIFGGSYGWSSAGRFHHAKGQLQRFLGQFRVVSPIKFFLIATLLGTRYCRTYLVKKASGAAPLRAGKASMITAICLSRLAVSGLKTPKLSRVEWGEHGTHKWLPKLRAGKTEFVSITPLKDDTADYLDAQWLAPRPNTDVALMLGLAHTLVQEDLLDRRFLATHCKGYEQFEPYLQGNEDGTPKTPEWAAEICGIDAHTIRNLARRMAAGRTMIGVAYALQRAEHG